MPDPAPIIALAGATGDLGGRVARELLARGARLRALVRPGTDPSRTQAIREGGAEVQETDFEDLEDLTDACRGAACVVSALSGLDDVIIGVQSRLLSAAEAAGVARFIPSDFSLDFTRLPRGTNRNLDLRKDFHARLESSSLSPTSILNGMFADLLNGTAPFVVDPIHRVIYYGNENQKMDFTTMDDTARYTAAAAMDPNAPRILRIAGDVLDARGLAEAASQAKGRLYKTLRVGGVGLLSKLIDVTRLITPGRKTVYPAWQGMQYMRNMYSGRGKLSPLDNDRYPGMSWTSVETVLREGTDTSGSD